MSAELRGTCSTSLTGVTDRISSSRLSTGRFAVPVLGAAGVALVGVAGPVCCIPVLYMRVVVMRVDLVSLVELVVDLGALCRRLRLLTLGRQGQSLCLCRFGICLGLRCASTGVNFCRLALTLSHET